MQKLVMQTKTNWLFFKWAQYYQILNTDPCLEEKAFQNILLKNKVSYLMKDGARRSTTEQRSETRLPLFRGSLVTQRSEVTKEAARVLGIPRAAMASLHRNSLMLERSTFLPSPSLRKVQCVNFNVYSPTRSFWFLNNLQTVTILSHPSIDETMSKRNLNNNVPHCFICLALIPH